MSKRWTDTERIFLKEHYNTVAIEDLEKHFDRSATSIRSQVNYLRQRGWTFNRKKDEQSNRLSKKSESR